MPCITIFFVAIGIHLATRMLMGIRADKLWGGAVMMACIQSYSYTPETSVAQWVPYAAGLLYAMFSLCGHFVSVHVIANLLPGLVQKETAERSSN